MCGIYFLAKDGGGGVGGGETLISWEQKGLNERQFSRREKDVRPRYEQGEPLALI